MANTEVGSAYVSIIPSLKGFNSKTFSGFQKAACASFAAIGASAGAMVAQATKSFAQFEQLQGGAETIFESAADSIVKNAQGAFDTAGISINGYMDQINLFGMSLKQSLGGDVQKAAQLGDVAIHDMADNTSVFGSNLRDVQNAYQGFAKQNYTMLDNLRLGYGGTREEMQRLIQDANAYEKANGRAGDLTIEKFGDVVQAIHDIQEAQGMTGNSAREAAHTISGSIDTMKAAWENWLTALADPRGDIDGMTAKLITSIGNVAKNLLPVIVSLAKNIAQALPAVLSTAIPALADIIATFFTSINWSELASVVSSGIGQAISMGINAITSIPDVAGKLIGLIQEQLKSATLDTSGLFAGVDFGDLSSALDTLKTTISQAFTSISAALGNSASDGSAFESFGQVIANVCTMIVNAINFAIPVVTAGVTSLIGLGQAVLPIMSAMVPIVSSILQTLTPLAGIIGPAVAGFMAFKALAPIIETLKGFQGAFAAVNAVMKANPILAIISAIALLVIGIKTLWDTNEGFRSAVIGIWEAVVGAFTTAAQTVQGAWQAVCDFFGTIVSAISGFLNGAGEVIGGIFQAAGELVINIWMGVISFFAPVPAAIIGFFAGIGGGISGFFSQAWELISGIWNAVISFFSGNPTAIIDFFTSIPEGIASFFRSAADTLRNIWDNAVSFIADIPGKIVGFFAGMHIEFPKIKLPHFAIKGSFSLSPPSIPTLSVDWYAKGGIFSSPSVIGVGEAGTEAVLPIDKLNQFIDTPDKSADEQGYGDKLDKMIQLLELLLQKDNSVYLNSTKISGELAVGASALAKARGAAL
nr:MAG TPA: tail tape measure protein [Caudoviricetes sp.]